jgi:hypothetical protein
MVASSCDATARAAMDGTDKFTITEGRPCPGWVSGVYSCQLKRPGVARCFLKFGGNPGDYTDFAHTGRR